MSRSLSFSIIDTEIESETQTLMEKVGQYSSADVITACTEELEGLEQHLQSQTRELAALREILRREKKHTRSEVSIIPRRKAGSKKSPRRPDLAQHQRWGPRRFRKVILIRLAPDP